MKKKKNLQKSKNDSSNNNNNVEYQNNEPKNDTSPIVYQRTKLKHELSIFERELTEKQKEFLNIALNKDTKMVFVSGPAGSSKTYITIYSALKLLSQKKVSDLLYIRSAVESADSKIGFLPGEADEKMAPYIQPLLEKLAELLPKRDIEILQKENRLDSIPLGFLRGLNWNAKCIVADEAQNMTVKEITTLITRVGEFSKVFILGDPDQSDINGKSGFMKIMNAFDDVESKENGIYTFKFTEEDIVRSGLVKYIVKKLKNVKSQ
jgi:phosphate starvation-inducible PhoH-like protein